VEIHVQGVWLSGHDYGALDTIFGDFLPSEVFMADQGRHFKNKKVQDFCDKWGTKFHSVAAYSPWINGLVEGMNKLLLYIL
jgi:hypothetical protein